MKQFSKVSFGFGVVTAGQRNVSYEPELVVTSNPGSFRITPPVSKALLIAHGDNVMFIHNIDQIDAAIQENNADLVKFCEEKGLEFGSDAANIAIHNEFDLWAIAKGITEFDEKGNKKMTRVRMTKEDKRKYVEANFEACLENAKNIGNEEFVAALTREGITEEEVKSLLIEALQGDEVLKRTGSKAANPAGMTGYNVTLGFTDSNVWNQMKADLKENADKVNRVFEVNIDELIDVSIFDGHKNVTVKAAVLGNYKDEKPSRSAKKENEASDAPVDETSAE